MNDTENNCHNTSTSSSSSAVSQSSSAISSTYSAGNINNHSYSSHHLHSQYHQPHIQQQNNHQFQLEQEKQQQQQFQQQQFQQLHQKLQHQLQHYKQQCEQQISYFPHMPYFNQQQQQQLHHHQPPPPSISNPTKLNGNNKLLPSSSSSLASNLACNSDTHTLVGPTDVIKSTGVNGTNIPPTTVTKPYNNNDHPDIKSDQVEAILPQMPARWYEKTNDAINELKRKLNETDIATSSKSNQFEDETTLSAPVSPKQHKYENSTTIATATRQPSIIGNCVQSDGFEAFFNPNQFKSDHDMKCFLKQQLQFSDLGKLFGNVDVSSVGPDHLDNYAQYLGLQPSVKFKCFKCTSATTFASLSELRDHHSVCMRQPEETSHTEPIQTIPSPKPALLPPPPSLPTSSIPSRSLSLDGPPHQPNYTEIDRFRITRKVYLCAACGTYYENWNLFYHMREVHKKFICLMCLRMLPTAERLVHHLEGKHAAKPDVYEHKEQLLQSIREQCYLMCSVCEHIFSEHDDFTSHSCENYIQACSKCGLKFIHKSNCLDGVQSMQQKKKKARPRNRERLSPNKGKLKTNDVDMADRFNNEPSITEVRATANGFGGENHPTGIPSLEPLNYPSYSSLLPQLPPATDKPNDRFRPGSSVSSIMQEPNNWSSELDPKSINNNNHHQQQISNNDSSQIHDAIHRNSSTSPEDYINNRDNMEINDMCDNDQFNGINQQDIAEKRLIHSGDDYCDKIFKVSSPSPPLHSELDTVAAGNTESNRPLLVPKLKLKISKEFQTPIESEESSTETSDEEGPEVLDEDEEELPEEEQEEEMEEETAKIKPEVPQILNAEPIEMMKPSPKAEEPTHEINEPQQYQSIEKDVDNTVVDMELEEDINVEELHEIEEPPELEPFDGIPVANDDTYLQELLLQQPLDRIPSREFIRTCLKATYPLCLYCNHARKIAVDGNSLALHILANHRFAATVDSITAEELQPATIVQRIKSSLDELKGVYFNLDTYDSADPDFCIPYEKHYECFQCRFRSGVHKELYLHNRKMHLKTVLFCIMCKSNFYSFSELVCHMCPGDAHKLVIFELKFRCVLCATDNIPSAFRLMVHLRKKHFACDVCLEECSDQSGLSSHVWKHKLHHLCYRCGIAYRNKPDITKHLFWKHGTESVVCKKCLQKKWPHVYHFCIPPSSFVCEQCNLSFRKAVALKVHKRLHSDDHPYPCTEDGCEKKFISRKLLLKHVNRHNEPEEEPQFVEPIAVDIKPVIEMKVEEMKTEIKAEDVVQESPSKLSEVSAKSETPKKRKKSKKSKESKEESTNNLIDLMNLPAPNLSESDSSDESDNEKVPLPASDTDVQPPPIQMDIITEEASIPIIGTTDDDKPPPIIDIWENFKSYQASQGKVIDTIEEEYEHEPKPPPILHVSQSDHDYCAMFKPLVTKVKELKKEEMEQIDQKMKIEDLILIDDSSPPEQPSVIERPKTPKVEPPALASSPKKGRSPKKALEKSTSDSSSGDSSDSDSSCSCGSNCSCTTSSSGSSSSSSSSDDSDAADSSSSEGRRKQLEKRALKQEKRERIKNEEEAAAKENSDNIDVVTNDNKPMPIIYDPDAIIHESDLETDESETDEEFYDEHPQRLADQMLAEKRRQLMVQTCMNPLNNYDIVENSRPSTPSLPEEMVKAKKAKAKKKKKERKKSVPALKLNIPLKMSLLAAVNDSYVEMDQPMLLTPPLQLTQVLPPPAVPPLTLNLVDHLPKSVPAAIRNNNTARHSTGSSCSDADTPLKRSKRRRIPNKFYGYTSDDEMGVTTPMDLFKPTPPPNLTWRKEDLPRTPTVIRTPPIKTTIKLPPSLNFSKSDCRMPSPIFEYTKRSPKSKPSSPALQPPPQPPPQIPNQPPIPPLIIRPNRIFQPPPLIEPMRVPAVPVHHIVPPANLMSNDSDRSIDSSDSDSSDEGALKISHPAPIVHQPLLPPLPPSIIKTTKKTKSFTKPVIKTIPPIPPIPSSKMSPSLALVANQIRYPIMPPAGCRPPREGESVYCYCRCPYDEVSEMIACDGTDCPIEWFHFECVNIMVPPKGTWYCPQCRPKYINADTKLNDDIT